tara:strand:+ start:7370 stop:7528 length:159 start_codon:yes stop_codon:yes gene_type:complete
MLAMDGCSVSGWIIIINGNCQSNIVCDGDSYWFDCCSDFGQDVGWCRGGALE